MFKEIDYKIFFLIVADFEEMVLVDDLHWPENLGESNWLILITKSSKGNVALENLEILFLTFTNGPKRIHNALVKSAH